jgi:NADP-dependent 3-hydroxy acid dehydrogenase YdfG
MPKVVMITGASSGFGEAAARRFAQDGSTLILAARSLDKLQALAASLAGQCSVYAAALDVTSQASEDAFFAGLPETHRAIDVLVNSAGVGAGAGARPPRRLQRLGKP